MSRETVRVLLGVVEKRGAHLEGSGQGEKNPLRRNCTGSLFLSHAKGWGRVQLPDALDRKYPNAPRDWRWQVWVSPYFESGTTCDG